jgi:hypothetical protein
MKLLLYGLVIYFLYKVIFEIVVPVSKGVKTVRQNMEQFQQQNGQTPHTNNTANTNSPKPSDVPLDAEYIDFEEVKEKK